METADEFPIPIYRSASWSRDSKSLPLSRQSTRIPSDEYSIGGASMVSTPCSFTKEEVQLPKHGTGSNNDSKMRRQTSPGELKVDRECRKDILYLSGPHRDELIEESSRTYADWALPCCVNSGNASAAEYPEDFRRALITSEARDFRDILPPHEAREPPNHEIVTVPPKLHQKPDSSRLRFKLITRSQTAPELSKMPKETMPSDILETPDPTFWTQQPQPRRSSKTSLSSINSERFDSPSETLIFVDWDDTISPSTWFKQFGADSDKKSLMEHERLVTDFFKAAVKLGRVIIVTMATTSWVEEAKKRMPEIANAVKELKIKLVSARESPKRHLIRNAFKNNRDPSTYLKTRTMERLAKHFYKGKSHLLSSSRRRAWKNIISIGDTVAERHALQDLVIQHSQRNHRGEWEECRCKTLLLMAEPSLHTMGKELQVLTAALPKMVQYDGDLHLNLKDGRQATEAMSLRLDEPHIEMPSEFRGFCA